MPLEDDAARACHLVGEHYGRRLRDATPAELDQVLVELVDDVMAVITTRCAHMTVGEISRAQALVEQRVGHLRLMIDGRPAAN